MNNTCATCGASFHKKRSAQKYCSKDCSVIGERLENRLRMRRKTSDPEFRKELNRRKRLKFVPLRMRFPERSKPCLVCGVGFKPKKRFSQKYCSEKCVRAVIAAKKKQYKQSESGKHKSRLRSKIRRNTDPHYVLKRLVGRAIWGALKKLGKEKAGPAFKFLPYSPVQLKVHLEGFFNNTNRFSWENHGKLWHIDHVIPQDMFHYTTMDCKDFRDCWALSNLMPSQICFNYEKGNRRVGTTDDHGQLVFLAS